MNNFAHVANIYEWTNRDIEETKEVVRSNKKMMNYIDILAQAHRAGYLQHVGNNFQRLKDWCLENGLGDPYGPEFDLKALDELAV